MFDVRARPIVPRRSATDRLPQVADNSSSVEPVAEGAVEELLRELVDARFVLTDRDGSLTRWSRPAEVLFGWPAARMLGRPLVETLELPGPVPVAGGG